MCQIRVEFHEECGPVAARQRQLFDLVHGDLGLESVLRRDLHAVDVNHVRVRIRQPEHVASAAVVVVRVGADRGAHDVQVVLGLEVEEFARRAQNGQVIAVFFNTQIGCLYTCLAEFP